MIFQRFRAASVGKSPNLLASGCSYAASSPSDQQLRRQQSYCHYSKTLTTAAPVSQTAPKYFLQQRRQFGAICLLQTIVTFLKPQILQPLSPLQLRRLQSHCLMHVPISYEEASNNAEIMQLRRLYPSSLQHCSLQPLNLESRSLRPRCKPQRRSLQPKDVCLRYPRQLFFHFRSCFYLPWYIFTVCFWYLFIVSMLFMTWKENA